ncbi:hypothetical protein GGS24DRAFT_455516 [Hypoxylon argillaceum]|nr:hypothetical protein GGS24DRAFT_455516 [Hypoxylon argillaceum]
MYMYYGLHASRQVFGRVITTYLPTHKYKATKLGSPPVPHLQSPVSSPKSRTVRGTASLMGDVCGRMRPSACKYGSQLTQRPFAHGQTLYAGRFSISPPTQHMLGPGWLLTTHINYRWCRRLRALLLLLLLYCIAEAGLDQYGAGVIPQLIVLRLLMILLFITQIQIPTSSYLPRMQEARQQAALCSWPPWTDTDLSKSLNRDPLKASCHMLCSFLS